MTRRFAVSTGAGQSHCVGDPVRIAFDHVGLDPAKHVRTDGA